MKVTSFSTQTSPMSSINFGTLLTTIFVVVDDWYDKQVKKTTLSKPGVKASMSVGLKRDKRYSDFASNATPGWCAARQMRYFGYKQTSYALNVEWNSHCL